jgi:hypothetical protein
VTETGTGKLWLDGVAILESVKYRVDDQRSESQRRITGRIDIDKPTAADLMSKITAASDVVLELENGRRWRCTLKAESGELVGRGEDFIEPDFSIEN